MYQRLWRCSWPSPPRSPRRRRADLDAPVPTVKHHVDKLEADQAGVPPQASRKSAEVSSTTPHACGQASLIANHPRFGN